MQLRTFRFSQLISDPKHYIGFLNLRKRIFVDQLGWQLQSDGEIELDQYDNIHSLYSIVTHKGKVIAGARSTPCDTDFYGSHYMLLDAHLGTIASMPGDLMDEYPTSRDTFECTRLAMDPSGLSSEQQDMTLKLVIFGLCEASKGLGATKLISLSPVTFGRLLRRLGYKPKLMGRSYPCKEDNLKYCVFQMPCETEFSSELRKFTYSHRPIQDQENFANRLSA